METQEPSALTLAAAGIEHAELVTESDLKIVDLCRQHIASLEAGGLEATITAQRLDLTELLDQNVRRWGQIATQAQVWGCIAEHHLPGLATPERVTLMRAQAAAAASLAASAAAMEAVVRLAARVEELRG